MVSINGVNKESYRYLGGRPTLLQKQEDIFMSRTKAVGTLT